MTASRIAWVLTDPATSDTWTMPINPDTMTSPFGPKSFKTAAGTKTGIGRVRTFQTAPTIPEWQWEGVIRTKQHYDDLVDWASRPGEVHVTDHLGRTFAVVIQAFQPIDRRSMATVPWRLRYTMKVLILRQL